jgi:hypothetical protein
MADPFEDFLSRALAPPERDPDRSFVSRVQARALLERRLEAQRRKILSTLGLQLAGLAAFAAAVWWLTRAPQISAFAGNSPAVLLLAVIGAFSFLQVLLISRQDALKGA